MEDTGQPIILGRYSTGYLAGTMAFIKLFNRELTEMQVIDLYTRELNLLNNL
jgi:hypothetical protein